MRGDETQPTAADGEAGRTRRGPRHAAPRKSLLTRLQGPAGKAIALAAMPTAVIVGMSLTPRPALADENDIPFAPGPCVTQPDEQQEEPDTSQEPTATPSASASKSPSTSAPDAPRPTSSPSAQPEPAASPSASGKEKTEPETTAPRSADPTAEPTAGTRTTEPAPTETRNPLDPLGVGETVKEVGEDVKDFLGGLLGTEDGSTAEQTEAQAQAQSPSQSEEESKPTAPAPPPSAEQPTAPKADQTVTETVTKPVEEVTPKAPSSAPKPVQSPGDPTKDAIKKAADQVGAEVKELPEDARGLDAKQDGDIPDGAKPRFPCPTPDPEALAAAELEPGMPQLPDEPWRLESTLLTLRGLDYHGIVEVQTGSGKVKKVLKFTASEVDIKDLHQTTVHSEGRKGHVTSRPGSTSTMRGGTVTMYTEELKGNLFGIIPVTFSPETPPPLDVPFAFFTNARVTQAGQFGGTLTVPGLRNFIEG